MISAFNTALNIVLEYWWVIAPVALFFILRDTWLNYVRTKEANSFEWMLLEIKIPKEVEKTPKAMEQILSGLHGVETKPNFVDKWFKGKMVPYFSFEIINKQGGAHFLIRTRKEFKNLVEAQIYAQHPGAEIFEVEDYIENLPSKIPNKNYNAWGTELILTKEDAYPIRTYPSFFEEAKKAEQWIDPLASLSEILSYLTPHENIWIQILISPIRDAWKEEGKKLVDKLIGRESDSSKKEGLAMEEVHGWADALQEGIRGLFSGPSEKNGGKKENSKKEPPKSTNILSPGQKDVISSIEKNISKLGFRTIIRFLYWGRSDVFSGANKAAIIGVFKQFNTQDLNGFRPNGKITPSINYFLKNRREFYRKVNLISNYKSRQFPIEGFSKRGFVFNTEELATIYHIPGKPVEAPSILKVEAKKAGPPTGLPTE